MTRTFFTIVIPTLNEEKRLPTLLSDLEKQTFNDFSVIVVDAMSSDATIRLARQHHARVVISNKKNVSYQRNLGAKHSQSEWTVFMDADNRIPKDYLQKIKEYVEIYSPDILSSWIVPDSRLKKDKITATLMNIFMEINKNASRPYILESMIFIKTKIFQTLGGFNTDIPWGEGEDMLGRAHKMGFKFEMLRDPKYTYSFRRLKKIGTFKMLQKISQIEIIKMVKGDLTKNDAHFFYPMNGGTFYKNGEEPKMTLQKFISILFQDKEISSKSLKSFKKNIDPWKSLFR
ncbi:hypothetical protein A2434_02470 [Candidatus Woesebacteria bacterium RIFOXYC1_FULL_41_14]|uniref:Glycosyl transferase family 2 n=2 Tax=Candidatus Woeseibacteriota TaxID=1752722 RepID=A0A0G0VSY0_9BACT|nr:MAG: Glycosyl transferase family 2 [Candidatus Woesebacteria bacterium GW2011_GWD1_41_12]KKS03990.1 MAG: Glycosyl transferase family 2 [Candidatus Woesebacteria bacterium GW2011_GWE1_41_24]OGM84640.1 MAG: hypothetical protein A2434_02470 [Candidatus Woesebacteria bacterium RIFOXYC1_FULL_41_14]